ncbi:MAG: serine/threonine protein kinase, partial [Planctomycetes bacterium]|nr:serine/threonine protein kinase [Planctomycetota bacterium]
MLHKTLGPYRIDRRLGHGGMGTVYAGLHCETGQWAAIKVLSENLSADPRFRERFQGEVETLERLNHPNIVKLIGYGEEEGQLFFVMELVEGPSLEAELQAGRRFHWEQVTDITIQICSALKHAHDHGVIHRDLKPANLLIVSDGTVKLTDFGIAKLFGVSGLTLAGSMIGTPDYMSPEQTDGHPATPRSDLYSLGCVMYALLAGKPPFSSPSITKVLDRVRKAEAPPLRRIVPDLPEPMERIVSQLLRKDPAQRIATPHSLANLLRAMKHALSGKGTDSEQAALESLMSGPPEGLDTTQRATLDFTPEEARRFAAGKTDFRAAEEDLGALGETTAFDPLIGMETVSPPRPTHFTAVSVPGARRERAASGEGAMRRSEWLTIGGITVALLAIIGAFVWAFLPASADHLYGRIEQVADRPEPPIRYYAWLEEFLTRFPDDPRAGQVRHWQQQRACRDLQQDLKNKVRSLSEPEKQYLEGMDLLDQGQSGDAC